MNSSLSQYFLKMMGIPVWRERHALPGAKPMLVYQTYALTNEAKITSGRLWLEMPAMDPTQEIAMFQLLDSMMSAIKLKRVVLLKELGASLQLQIVMGLRLAQELLTTTEDLDSLREKNLHKDANGLVTLVSYHPLALLADPKLKRKAWEDLQKVEFPLPLWKKENTRGEVKL
jgi:hypothetical protein